MLFFSQTILSFVLSKKIINKNFDRLENSIKDIPATNIFNYNETNITEAPGAKHVITHQGRNRVERVMHHPNQR